MNQEKIGKFIAKCRKEKRMTQEQLALKLGVTDKSISNWETGKNMPDLSLFKILCDELDISINDLMSGEKVNENNYQEKFEENIINTISNIDNQKTNKRKNNKLLLIIFIIFIIGILMFNNIQIKLKYDEDKMYLEKNNKYGLRFVSKNSCTIYSGNINYIVVPIKIDKKDFKIIFINSKCSLKEIYKYNKLDSASFRYLNLNIFDDNYSDYYKIYYTNYDLNKIKKMSQKEIIDVINNSHILLEKKDI